MHMRARPCQEPIVNTGKAFATALRQRLAPERWPIPPRALPTDAVLVGGAVRDAALGRLEDKPDLDLVLGEGAISLGRQLARDQGGTCVVLDHERDIARVVLAGWTIDLARRQGADLASDLQRRDYTVNAIALPLAPGSLVVDPTGGLDHLNSQTLVAVAEANLLDDPLRLLRGVRLATELGFSLEATTLQWIRTHARRLEQVAGERVLMELEKLSVATAGQRGLALALDLKLLEPWGAQPAAALPFASLTVTAAQEQGLNEQELAAALPIARMAWLLDGAAAARLKGSRRLQLRCDLLRRWWDVLSGRTLDGLSEPERLDLHQALDADLPALLLNQSAATCQAALIRWRNPADPLFHPRSPLDGHQLQQSLGLPPGPELGLILRHLMRERALARLPDQDITTAINAARQWLEHKCPAA
jgi:tRNA nucleotidyltransferase (CCA-adding enzyme)